MINTKLWQKIYLLTIFLFVILLNSGMFLVFNMTYQKNLATEQVKAESEYNMIATNILRSLQNLAKQNRLREIPIQSVLEIHEKYYAEQKINLIFWKDGQYLYPKGKSSTPSQSISDKKIQSKIYTQNEKNIIQIQSMLYENQEKYYLQYEKALSELDDVWEQLERKYLLVSVGFSLGLAILLFILLNRIMRPIQELTQTVDQMRTGNLSARVNIKVSDDIATLGEHFNKMAEKIQNDILLIQKDAQAKQDFVDNFAHELKSPITSIYGFAEYIQKAKVPEQEITECMAFIMEESTRLLKLSYTLLDMAKMRKKEIAIKKVSIHNLFDSIRKPIEKHAADCGVFVGFNTNNEEIQGNEILLQSLLYNLAHNGICACQKGGKVIIAAEHIQGRMCLTVTDNGCGIPKNEIEKITEPFYRVDKARNRAEGRTGLGLALCKQIASLHGAKISFLSEENNGTKVIVQFFTS